MRAASEASEASEASTVAGSAEARASTQGLTPGSTREAWTNRTFSRVGSIVGLSDPCMGTFSNSVSNAPPANPAVFAAAARGLVQRVVEGSGAEPGRNAQYWEVWNESALAYAWTGATNDYFDMALPVLVQLDAYRSASSVAKVKALKFGFGSFASSQLATAALGALDTTALPNGAFTPFDFISFHAYDNDPLKILEQVKQVSDAREASTHYRNAELVLAEWGPFLDQSPLASSMDLSLLVSTVLARAPALGVTRTHRSLFVDFVPGFDVPFAPLKNDGTAKPLYRAYELLHALVGAGGARLPVDGAANGSLSGGLGAVLVLKPATGGVRALLVNRDTVPHSTRLELGGAAVAPTRVRVFDAPAEQPRDVTPTAVISVPARAVVLIEQ
jgi:hypothetical protein